MKSYIKRLAITAIAFCILLCIVFIIRYFLDNTDSELSLFEFIKNSANLRVLYAYIGFVVVYPFYGFGLKKRHLTKDYSYNKEAIEKIISSLNYIKAFEDSNRVVFRKEKISVRLYHMYLDEIEISIKDNPIIFNGRRRELMKINRMLDDALL